ncbi:MAG TPA: hypothetical protein VLL07_05375 [Pontiella sp.]|nr:hypothetical protein [Pontiella sp.]
MLFTAHMKELLKKARKRVWLEGDPDRDRSTGLAVFGALEIAMGLLTFFFAMFLLVLVSETGIGGMKRSHCWITMSFLFYMTGWFCVMGFGSIKAFRWARALMLVGSWVTVFFGTLVLALVLHLLPWVYNLLADAEILSPQMALVALYAGVLVLITVQLVFPMASIVFYSLKGVRATCERRHPEPSWSDRCPLPLMAMGFVSALGVSTLLFGATTNYIVFLFGRIWTGFPGFTVVAAIACACGYVGRGAFARKMRAWWAAYAIILLTSSSMMLTFAELDMEDLYERMGYSAVQVASLQQFQFFSPALLTFGTCLWGIMACTYLVWVRDCFRPEKDAIEVKSYQQRKAEETASRLPEDLPDVRRPRMRLDD